MKRPHIIGAFLTLLIAGSATAQSPGILYTWPGTGDVAEWVSEGANFSTVANSTAGLLTVTELGDELDPGLNVGGPHTIHDAFNRRREQSTEQGGLDLTGLDFIELDVSHNGTSNIDVQFYMQTTPSYTYLWYGPSPTYAFQGPDWSLPPNVVNTLRFPVNQLTAAQQAWITAFGLSVRNHAAVGNVTWTISEVRATGAGLSVRDLATHNAGTSDNGLNGAFVNFGNAAVVGNDGGQNQTGLSQVSDGGVGALEWTDKGNGGVTTNPSGAAITWVNGTAFTNNNSFYERLADFSNYNRLTLRMKATDVNPGGGGSLFGQAFFHTGAYNFQVAGAVSNGVTNGLPIDGQYHDVVFSLAGVTNLQNVQDFGIQLFGHQNDLRIDVDYVRFSTVAGVPGDYNGNGTVDAADYVLWRDGGPLQNEVDTPGTVNAADYAAWRARFGNTAGSGSLGGSTVPEAGSVGLLIAALGGVLAGVRQRG